MTGWCTTALHEIVMNKKLVAFIPYLSINLIKTRKHIIPTLWLMTYGWCLLKSFLKVVKFCLRWKTEFLYLNNNVYLNLGWTMFDRIRIIICASDFSSWISFVPFEVLTQTRNYGNNVSIMQNSAYLVILCHITREFWVWNDWAFFIPPFHY